MADLPRKNISRRFPFTLCIKPYLLDHFFEGKAVFPAVEALIALARAVRQYDPHADLHDQTCAQFPRMLAVDPAGETKDAQIEIEDSSEGIRASLLTVMKMKSGSMSRILEHAKVTFTRNATYPQKTLPLHEARELPGGCIHVPAVSIYRELVPFGPSYQNITGDLAVSREGAFATVAGGGGEADDSVLGSPFVLDAAMHAACVWGQRFTGLVPFPVGLDRRIIHKATKKGESYFVRIVPVDVSREPLLFDAWIFDQNGVICESVSGLRMRDITRGRMRPPQWIREGVWKKS